MCRVLWLLTKSKTLVFIRVFSNFSFRLPLAYTHQTPYVLLQFGNFLSLCVYAFVLTCLYSILFFCIFSLPVLLIRSLQIIRFICVFRAHVRKFISHSAPLSIDTTTQGKENSHFACSSHREHETKKNCFRFFVFYGQYNKKLCWFVASNALSMLNIFANIVVDCLLYIFLLLYSWWLLFCFEFFLVYFSSLLLPFFRFFWIFHVFFSNKIHFLSCHCCLFNLIRIECFFFAWI